MGDELNEGEGGGEGGATFQRVRGELLGRLTDGTYALGSRLPSQRELADEFGVSRDTVQNVMRDLIGEGWLSSRQGSGTRVIKGQSSISSSSGRKVTLSQLVDEAFSKSEVTLDVFTLSSESLAAQIRRQDEQLRLRKREKGSLELQSITLRMLLPRADLKKRTYPKAVNPEDDAAVWERHLVTMRSSTTSIKQKLNDLRAEGLVPSVDVQIRYVDFTPQYKVYLVDGSAALWAPYVPVRRSVYLEAQDKDVEAIDVLGVGAPLAYDVKDDNPQSPASEKVDNLRKWFEGNWGLLTV
ncbi:winged helix-turn-helix domain-containing protein [Streptomyces sp. 351MFTsu5.1]|uniref:winged helix-turn-helix domain-containing protein n=1 Tax=Streptomyces sp. 351MFTsu5.1 TaxID=1172180 RepID=UPI00036D5113|nr:GntR family transcriptional regulator [Streptomyces sp. 351MFTsu5.1]